MALLSKTIPVTVLRGVSTTTVNTNDGSTVEIKTIDNALKRKALSDRERKYPNSLFLIDRTKSHHMKKIGQSGFDSFTVTNMGEGTSKLTISSGVNLIRDHSAIVGTPAGVSHTEVDWEGYYLNPELVTSWEDVVTIQAVNYSNPAAAYDYFYSMPFDNDGGSRGKYYLRMTHVGEFLKKYNVGDVGFIFYLFKNGNRSDLITWYTDFD